MVTGLVPRLEGDGPDFWIDDIRFRVLSGPPFSKEETGDEGVVILKTWAFATSELKALGDLVVRRMLELGVWQGGSAVLWSLVWPLERYVGIDRPDRSDIAFPAAVLRHPRWGAVRLRGGIAQQDRVAVARVIEEEFDGPLDLVIDDCSHLYAPSLASFETVFPRLRPGGVYMIEDWGWAHRPAWQPSDHRWAGEPSLSNLILRLVLLAASEPGLIPRLEVYPGFVLVHRGNVSPPEPFSVEGLTLMRGRRLPLI